LPGWEVTLRLSSYSTGAIGTYALAALLAFMELAVLWQALHPQVSEPFRAYYIDRTTTCLPQPVSGAYELGTEIDFTRGGPENRERRPCGWEGPAGDGLHSLGQSSRLKLEVGEAQPLTLMLELAGTTLPGPATQTVTVSVNDVVVGETEVTPDQRQRFTFAVPAEALGEGGFAEILLDYPDAIGSRPGASNTHWRAVKLTAGSLSPAD
jgi:hypothetical protein